VNGKARSLFRLGAPRLNEKKSKAEADMEAVFICGVAFLVFAFFLRIPISFSVGMCAVLY
jgi:hypothetical protein